MLIVAPPLALDSHLQLVCQRHHTVAGAARILFARVSVKMRGSRAPALCGASKQGALFGAAASRRHRRLEES
ncbi:MAG TPA: hypothetical protein VGU61_15660 [Noviherbaspirillum sp.]|uniref:hypothetical protein n=1 Tax=Noviherbaspirillum sp. TaxID=1926288 RepID=UPI002DDD1F77|nr:hypothetical protein [Noviherbaspirillum sp.]HEV2611705.1 hypothetical protein [Noviherbaspirillum sp.]